MKQGRVRMIKTAKMNKTTNLVGKTVAVTGTTGGLGREICKAVVSLGADIVLIDRDARKSSVLQRELAKVRIGAAMHRVELDLSHPEQIKSAAKKIAAYSPDYLILNAGVYHVPRYKCTGNIDNVFMINFLSHYLLVRVLLPNLRKANAKVVAVGSIAHNYSRTDENDIDFSGRASSALVYGNSKRYLMFALSELLKNEPRVSFTIAHPGITFTGITDHYPPAVFAVIKHPMKIIFPPPRVAARNIVYGMFDSTEKNEWIGPRYFNIWGRPEKHRLTTCQEDERQMIFKNAELLADRVKCETDPKPDENTGEN